MPIEVRHIEGLIQVETERLHLGIHPHSLGIELVSREGPTRIAGIRPRVQTDAGRFMAEELIFDGRGEIRTAMGLATRILLRCHARTRLELELAIDVGEDWSGIAIDVAVSNRGSAPVEIRSFDPLWWDRAAGGELALDHPPGSTEFFEMGYHSCAPSGYVPLFSARNIPRLLGARRHDRGPFTPSPSWGIQVSDQVTSLRAIDREGLTIGFLSCERFLGFVYLQARNETFEEIIASSFTEAMSLAPGTHLRAERLWLGIDPPGSDGIAEWATRAGKESAAPVPARPRPSWTAPASVVAALPEAVAVLRGLDVGPADLELGPDVRLPLGDPIPASLGLAEQIARTGVSPRIWLAPFLVDARSEVALTHPEWLRVDAAGDPIRPVRSPYENADSEVEEHTCRVLDPSHPEVWDWLGDLGRSLREMGVEELRIDYLDAGTLPGLRAHSEYGIAECYRRCLRELSGAERGGTPLRLYASRAPLGPSIGLVHVMQIAPEPGARWRPGVTERALGADRRSSAEATIRAVLGRAVLNQRLWVNDPGPIDVFEAGELSGRELRTLHAVLALSGGLLRISGPIERLGPEPRRVLRQLFPPLRVQTRARLAPDGPPQLVAALPDGGVLVLAINLQSRSAPISIDLGTLGVEPPLFVWDVWEECAVEITSTELLFEEVLPHDAIFLRVSPVDAQPRLLGSTLHIAAGGVECGRIFRSADGVTTLALRQPGARRGTVTPSSPDGAPTPVSVSFVDQMELRIWGDRVDEMGKIPER